MGIQPSKEEESRNSARKIESDSKDSSRPMESRKEEDSEI